MALTCLWTVVRPLSGQCVLMSYMRPKVLYGRQTDLIRSVYQIQGLKSNPLSSEK